MASLKKYDVSGKELGAVEIDDTLVDSSVHSKLVKDYIVAIRKNMRQWSANTKGRTEVQCSNKKPHPQKGTGRARQGTVAAPQYKGGGIVFGPKPKFDMHTRINKKERQKAVKAMLSEKISGGDVHILDTSAAKAPSTKQASAMMHSIGIKGRKTLFLGQSFNEAEREVAAFTQTEAMVKSLRNLPRVTFMPTSSVSGYDLISADQIVVTENALDEMLIMLGRSK